MSHVIVIRGPLGVGKSVVSRLLAEQLHGLYISIDSMLEELDLDKVEGECIPVQNFISANEHVLPQIKNAMKSGTSVIIDGNFYHKEQLDHLRENLKELNVFTLHASVDTCVERDRRRENPYGEDAARAVHSLVSRFDAGISIDSDGKHPQQIVDGINTFLTDTNSLA